MRGGGKAIFLKIRRFLLILGCCVLLILSSSSCRKHKTSQETAPISFNLSFAFATDLPPYLTVEHQGQTTRTDEEQYSFRYTVKFYPRLSDGTFSRTENDDYTLILTKDDISSLDYSTKALLPEGNWQIRCWADYVKKGSKKDLFYETSDFSAITLPQEHRANTDRKDAFYGSSAVNLVRGKAVVQTPPEVRLDMERPLAKFQFIATDFDRLLMGVLNEKSAAEAKVSVCTPSQLRSDVAPENAWDPSKTAGFEPSDYYLRFSYTTFMPYVFDVFTNKPIDARSGVQFDSEFTPLSMDEVLMGFDYVLVNGRESSVTVQVGLYERATNELLSLTPVMNVPLKRSRVTTVRGDFLTLKFSTDGGIGINPDFDGEYNMALP